MCVQPTCPLRKPKHILETIKKLISKNYNGVYTVSETAPKEHPYRQILINKGVPKLMIKSAKNIVASSKRLHSITLMVLAIALKEAS